MMPNNHRKTEALRVRQMFRFKRPDGAEYENPVRTGRLDKMVEDLSVKDIQCKDLGIRKGQIWKRKNDRKHSPKIIKNNPNLGEWEHCIVTKSDGDKWVFFEPYDIEKRVILDAYQSQSMERQSYYINSGFELAEGKLFKENK